MSFVRASHISLSLKTNVGLLRPAHGLSKLSNFSTFAQSTSPFAKNAGAPFVLRQRSAFYRQFATETTEIKPTPAIDPIIATLPRQQPPKTPGETPEQPKKSKSTKAEKEKAEAAAASQTPSPIQTPTTTSDSTASAAAPAKTTTTEPAPIVVKPSFGQKMVSFAIKCGKGTLNISSQILKNPKIVVQWSRNAKDVIKKEAHHYWMGSKLFAADVKVAYKLVQKVLKGSNLTRRERKQLSQTAADMFRLVPFIMIVLIPFAEFCLPVLLKLFPNMLPSQFEDKHRKEENMMKSVKAKLELAKFLQETVENMASKLKNQTNAEMVAAAEKLEDFVHKVRNGEPVANEEIAQFAKLFSDEITLDNLERPQLVAMCKYMGLPPFGNDTILRFNLRNKLRQIKADDRLIHWEGVNSLSLEELQSACSARGMRATGISKTTLRRQLSQWLELSLNHSIPSSLLILSRALTFTDKNMNPAEALTMAVGSLPNEVVEEVAAESGATAANTPEAFQRRLDQLKRQEERIEEEKEHLEETKEKVMEKAQRAQQEAASAEGVTTPVAPVVVEVTAEKIINIGEAVATLASHSPLSSEKEELRELQVQQQRVVEEKKAAVAAGPAPELPHEEVKGLDMLHTKVEKMLSKLEKELHKADSKIGSALKKIDQDSDGVITIQELEHALQELRLKPTTEEMKKIVAMFDKNNDGIISIQELQILVEDLEKLEHEGGHAVIAEAEAELQKEAAKKPVQEAAKPAKQ